VLVLDGFGLKIFVRHGQLVLADGVGDERRERRLARSNRDVDRIVLLGNEGFITLEAVRWLDRVGIALVQLDADGRLLMRSVPRGKDNAGLRRAQALMADSPLGMAIARSVLVRKLADQALVIRDFAGDPHGSNGARATCQ
jgi:CRISPR/Cas system-associated endonuclease Cas1